MLLSFRFVTSHSLYALFLVGACLAGALRAAESPMTEWKDAKGAVFRGEPIEVIGPLALWRTSSTASKFLPLRVLSPEDCVRFYRAIAAQPERAAYWSGAKGRATSELIGRLQEVRHRTVAPMNFAGRPEPELLIVLFGSRQAEGINNMLNNLGPFMHRVERVYPGRVATVVMSTWGTVGSNLNPRSLPEAWTWLVVDANKQSDMKLLSRFAPGGGFVMVLMTRQGVPLFGSPANSIADVMHFVDGASDMLWQLNPANPSTGRDRAHYLRATRPVQFAESKAPPLLLTDLFKVEGLRRNGIARIEAKMEIAADGFVTRAEMQPAAEMPATVVAPLTEAIRKTAQFVPAIENGAPVASTYDYSFTVGPADPQLAADAAWVNGEARVNLPLKSWLILKPVHVPEQVFGGIDSVGPDGLVMMKAVTAGDASKISVASQKSSFNTDWFSEAGPASVSPKAGDKQTIDGTKLVWKQVEPYDGLVDFMGSSNPGSLDYCIGYAWTEFDSPDERDAWLGIGSDDGLKVWLNGELVNDKWQARQSRLDDDVVPLRLKKGKNQILIKIQNVRGLWSFTARLRVRG